MFSIPSSFSIFGIILMKSVLLSSKIARISNTSEGLLTKLAAMKSIPCSIPKRISLASLSVIPGKLTLTPGRFTPFLFLSSPELSTEQ